MKLGKMGNILCNCVSSSLLIPRLIPVKLLTKQCVTWSDMEQSNNDKVNDNYNKDYDDCDNDDMDDDDVWLNRWVAWPKVTLRGGEKNLGSVGALVKPALLWESPFLRYEIERGLRAVCLRANFPPLSLCMWTSNDVEDEREGEQGKRWRWQSCSVFLTYFSSAASQPPASKRQKCIQLFFSASAVNLFFSAPLWTFFALWS